MGYSPLCQRVSRFFRKRGVREGVAQVSDPRGRQDRRWPLPGVLETVLAGLVLQICGCRRLDERTPTSPPVWGRGAVGPDS